MGTGLVRIPTLIVANNTRIVLVITLSEDNNEDNSILRVIKLVSLDQYNGNRERLLL